MFDAKTKAAIAFDSILTGLVKLDMTDETTIASSRLLNWWVTDNLDSGEASASPQDRAMFAVCEILNRYLLERVKCLRQDHKSTPPTTTQP